MAAAGPVQDKTREAVLRLHGEGVGRNEIARRLDLGAGSVSRIVAAAGLVFEDTTAAGARKHARMNREALRGDVIDRLLLRSRDVLARLEAETYTYRMASGDGIAKITDDDPPAIDERNLATALGIYLDKAARLEQLDLDPGEVGAKAMLRRLGEALGVA